jgi:DHA1 family bicyclomycin/chloramphenicol resistance-like MFS transporter
MIVGGLICTLGAVGCALAPSIGLLIVFRVVQGFGGGLAAVVARTVVVDVAKGDLLAKVMSIMMALGGLAPMVALGGTWRTVFWFLLMMITAILFDRCSADVITSRSSAAERSRPRSHRR